MKDRSGYGCRRLPRIAGALALLASAAPANTAHSQSRPLAGLEEYVERGRQAWGIPGVAIAVVKDDSIVFVRGFGVRRLGESAPVDERTMFAIGSSSKTFTSAALALLVDEGKLTWDSRVAAVLPGFELADQVATAQTTIRDLLSHRTGLPGENLIFWGTSLNRDQVLARLRYLPLASSPRSRYEYQNLMFLAAGQIIPAATGQTWDDFVTSRLFTPLGMTRSTTRVADLERFDDIASPHAPEGGTMRPIPWLNLDNAGPAGSIVSDVLDMAQWVRLQLGNGRYRGRRLISERELAAMHSPQMLIPNEPPYSWLMPDAHLRAYGLGWMLHDYHDRLVVEHAGQTDGMHATVAMMPEEALGVVVLTNSVLFGFPAAIMHRVFDAYLGRPARDWTAELKRALAPMNKYDARPLPRRLSATKPSLPLEKYVGTYRHRLYGDATVTLRDGRIDLNLLGQATPLEHWHFDTFATAWPSELRRGLLPFASFLLDSRGEARKVVFEGGLEFERVRPSLGTPRDSLSRGPGSPP